MGVIIVDHGSKRESANEHLDRVRAQDTLLNVNNNQNQTFKTHSQIAEIYRSFSEINVVEPAHMEIAEPSIATGDLKRKICATLF